jgi:ATP-dependent Clp protease adaptor protein ClpS
MNQNYKTEELEELLEDVVVAEPSELVVFNDDFNTFAHVTETLISVCKHTPEQAEQCTWINHYKGKCCVKMGEAEKLNPMKRAICDAGIDARIL